MQDKGGIMKEFTIQEVIEYAQRIEMESYQFYKRAAEILEDPETVDLVEKLSEEEEKHYNHLGNLLSLDNTTPDVLGRKIQLDKSDYADKIVSASEISIDATTLDILNIALEREKNTELLYGMLLSLTDLNEAMTRMFEDLKKFEQRHVDQISAMIERV
jgi:rubrerythrin